MLQNHVSSPLNPLDLIHSDIMCIQDSTSKDGYNYALTLIDDYSRFGITNLMKRKSEAFENFLRYKAFVEKQQGREIKMVRTDRGGEFMSNEFDAYLENMGIARQLIIPGTPQQNGIAERRNRTLADATRCLLLESGLPLRFWGEALACATYLKNRSPTNANEGKTPFERWFGSKPSWDHLRIFGCRAWYKSKENQSKFEPRGRRGILV